MLLYVVQMNHLGQLTLVSRVTTLASESHLISLPHPIQQHRPLEQLMLQRKKRNIEKKKKQKKRTKTRVSVSPKGQGSISYKRVSGNRECEYISVPDYKALSPESENSTNEIRLGNAQSEDGFHLLSSCAMNI